MSYVILGRDVHSKDGRLYAKRGKRLYVLFKNGTHYVCEIGKLIIPVFFSQVEREITKDEDEQEIVETVGEEDAERCGGDGEDTNGEIFDHLRN